MLKILNTSKAIYKLNTKIVLLKKIQSISSKGAERYTPLFLSQMQVTFNKIIQNNTFSSKRYFLKFIK